MGPPSKRDCFFHALSTWYSALFIFLFVVSTFLHSHPYLFHVSVVVGEKETASGTVNVRTRDNKVHGEHTVDHVIERFRALADSKTLEAEQEY